MKNGRGVNNDEHNHCIAGVAARELNEHTVHNADQMVGHVIIEKVKYNKKAVDLLARALGKPTKVDGALVTAEWFAKNEWWRGVEWGGERGYSYELYHECTDPQADEDETDAYRETQRDVIFVGLSTCGGSLSGEVSGVEGGVMSSGDYNEERVFCWKRDIEAVSQVLIDLACTFFMN